MLLEQLRYLLQGLAYFGVWLLNVLIYESIATVVWIGISYPVSACPRIPRKTADKIELTLFRAAFISIFAAAILVCIFDWARIVPFPTYKW